MSQNDRAISRPNSGFAQLRQPRWGLSVLLASVISTGCASVAVSEDAILTNTARALGLDRTAITISERVDQGVQTTYKARTRSGKMYSCYVTGTFSLMGKVVSDAICTEIKVGGTSTTSPVASSTSNDSSCNALSRAAGRCK